MRYFATTRHEEAFAALEPIFEWLLSLPDDEYEQIEVAALIHSMRTAYRMLLDREYAAA